MALARQNLEEALSYLKGTDDKANLAWSIELWDWCLHLKENMTWQTEQ
jgi:hypothetical protein